MAYNSEHLSQTGQVIGGGHKRFTYLTTDSVPTVSADDYFADEERLTPGDYIYVIAVDSIDPRIRLTATTALLVVSGT